MADDLREFVHERFRRSDEKLDRVIELLVAMAGRLSSIEARMTSLEASIVHVHERVDGAETGRPDGAPIRAH
jgi:hypothetical protein